ncbi:hypothetical protein DFJ73DRAFT_849949 [Zopfochytrium polystomum]|nr:hypothetical protein DFJ73DRAFT_849949 [Zopfochytrium polystomum]
MAKEEDYYSDDATPKAKLAPHKGKNKNDRDQNLHGQDNDHDQDHEDAMLDLLVVGGGPHALSLLCHLLERSPYSLVTDESHQRIHHIAKKRGNARTSLSPKQASDGPLHRCCSVLDAEAVKRRILVVDGSGNEWMSKWNKSFEAYQIEFLRSPMYFHPDPFHVDALRAFTEAGNREKELQDITASFEAGCKACKKTKTRSHFSANDRNQFYTPKQRLFSDFCMSLVDRYFLHDILKQGWVTDIDPVVCNKSRHFKVTFTTPDGMTTVVRARTVVAALGNSNIPNIPPWARMIPAGSYPPKRLAHALDFVDCLLAGADHCSIHCEDPKGDILPADLQAALAEPRSSSSSQEQPVAGKRKLKALIIGGGLTSAQLVDLAVKRGFDEVVLITRSKLRTMQFDLSFDWIGRNSAIAFSRFWRSDSPEVRREMLRKAKNGGSITPEYMKILKAYVAAGKLVVKENLQVKQADWLDDKTENPLQRPCWRVNFGKTSDTLFFDLIWMGTGATLDVKREPCLTSMLRKSPIEVVGGLPVLTRDLRWNDLEFYMMSGYCGLSLGPTAGNIIGGKLAAERIAMVLWNKWRRELATSGDEAQPMEEAQEDEKPDLTTLASMTGSFVNFWSVLTEL